MELRKDHPNEMQKETKSQATTTRMRTTMMALWSTSQKTMRKKRTWTLKTSTERTSSSRRRANSIRTMRCGWPRSTTRRSMRWTRTAPDLRDPRTSRPSWRMARFRWTIRLIWMTRWMMMRKSITRTMTMNKWTLVSRMKMDHMERQVTMKVKTMRVVTRKAKASW